MLASATDHLCRTQPYHFPGIVADISLENLCSPTADEKYYNAFSKKPQHLNLSSEVIGRKSYANDINQNISDEDVLKPVTAKLKEPNANCDYSDEEEKTDIASHVPDREKLSIETSRRNSLSTSNIELPGSVPGRSTTQDTSFDENKSDVEEKCATKDSTVFHDGSTDKSMTKSSPVNQKSLISNETKEKGRNLSKSKATDGKESSSNCDIPVSSEAERKEDMSKQRSSISRNPFVNIRTLGDGSDGAYEINIQNLYPANIQYMPNEDDEVEDKNAHLDEVFQDKETGTCESSEASESTTNATPQNEHLLEYKDSEERKREYNSTTADIYQASGHPDTSKVTDEQLGHLNKDLMLKLQKLLKTCAKNHGDEHDVKEHLINSKREYILMRSYSDGGCTPKSHDSAAVKENGISRSPPIETYDVQRRRKRRPRKLPEIPKQSHKDLNVSLPVKVSNKIQDPPNDSVLSLADELRIAALANNEISQSEVSKTYKPTVLPSPPSNLELSPSEHVMSKSQNLMTSSGINSIVGLKELGSPEDIEPPSFRDSGFFQDIEYDEDIVKQQMQIEKQQQVFLRTLYKDRSGKAFANDCDSGYTTQDPESQSRPTSVGPNLCCKCGSEVVAEGESSVPKKLHNSQVDHSLGTSTQSITDCYIDDIPKANEPPKREITLEYSGPMCREPPDGGDSDRSPEEVEEKGAKLLTTLSTQGNSDKAPGNNDLTGISEMELMYLDVTHRCCHKFVPRHGDELFIEIGDPIYVCKEEDDLWCQGVNLRTKKKGIFPSVCATDLNFLEGEGDGQCRPVRFYLRFLGSVQVKYAKGSQVLTQAIQKVVMSRRMTLNSNPPPMSCLEINDYGIKLSEKTTRKVSSSSRMPRSLSQILGRGSTSATESDDNSHFYSLKNVTYCGYHATNQKYFGFITKHPLEMKFACHVMLGEESTRGISEAVSAVFKKYYQKYLADSHPTEDIYLED